MTFRRSKSMVLGLLICGVLALSLLISTPVRAQVVGATLSGTVSDSSGAVIPNAQLSIKNVATGVIRDLTADTAGFYTAPNISSGSYEISVTAPGFKTAVQSGIALTVGAQQTLNITMQVGAVSEKVEVTVEAPVVELSSSSLGNLVGATTVVELPLNGRDWASLAVLEPGVAAIQDPGLLTTAKPRSFNGYGNPIAIAGARPQMLNYRLDGLSIVDYAGGPPASVVMITMGVDAIGEFSVVTGNSSAEYGRSAVGSINAVTKSGTNLFHGNAYWFLRDSHLDARSATDPAAGGVPPFHRNQFGGSVGGPILKKKTFFFFNFEGFRQDQQVTNSVLSPSQNTRNGIMSVSAGGATAPLTSCPLTGFVLPVPGQSNVCVSTAVIPFFAFWPVPTTNQLIGVGDIGRVPVGTSNIASENYETGRVDHTISAHDSLNFSFFVDRAIVNLASVLNTTIEGDASGRTMGTAAWTHIFNPSLINTLRVGYSRTIGLQGVPLGCIQPLACDTSGIVSALPGRPAAGISAAGITAFSGGPRGASTLRSLQNAVQGYDDAFLTRGAHSLKFGFAVENDRVSDYDYQGRVGSWTFPGLIQLLQNKPSQMRRLASIAPADFDTGGFINPQLKSTIFAGYVQDDWRLRSNLTLNLGLRYEMATAIIERTGLLQNLPCMTCAPVYGPLGIQPYGVGAISPLGNHYFNNPTKRNFAPRVGFAWDPFRDGKTSVRAAFGMFDILPVPADIASPVMVDAPGAATYVFGTSALPQGSFPNILSIPVPSGLGAPITTAYIENNPKRSYVMVYNLTVQRQLTSSTSVTIGYVGNRGVHLADFYGNTSGGTFPAGYTAGGQKQGMPYWAVPIGSGTKINRFVSTNKTLIWNGNSMYNGLLASVNKKISHGFQLQASYTWSKSMDINSSPIENVLYLNSISTPLSFLCFGCAYGPSDFDITQRFVGNLIWDLPSPKSLGAFASHALGGWEVATIITATSGTPFTPMISGDPQGTLNSDTPFDVPDRLRGPGCSTAVNPGNTLNYIKLNCFALPTAPAGSSFACAPFTNAPISQPNTCANLQGNAGRNSLRGPGFLGMDFSVFKNVRITRISENFNLQFRAEMFNILNHADWQEPYDTNILYGPTGAKSTGAGVLDQLATPGRQIQFGLKLIF